MVQDDRNIGTGYAEPFDVARFQYIADLVKAGKGTTGLSDLECFLHAIMKHMLEDGK